MGNLIVRVILGAIGLVIIAIGVELLVSATPLLILKTGRNSIIPTLYAVFGDEWGRYVYASIWMVGGGLFLLLATMSWTEGATKRSGQTRRKIAAIAKQTATSATSKSQRLRDCAKFKNERSK